MAIYHMATKNLSHSSRNTVGAVAYRAGCKLVDAQTGQSFDYRDKPVQHVELLLSDDAPQWAQDLQKLIGEYRDQGVQKLSDIAEAAEKRKDSRVYREIEFALPQEFTDEQNIALSKEYLQDQCCRLGIGVLANFHMDVDEETGEYKPHCHALLLTRRLEESGLSVHKERSWNTKSQLLQWREQWAAYANFHLQMNGFAARIDHRSNKERGIELEGQSKLGKGVKELERRLQKIRSDSLEKEGGENDGKGEAGSGKGGERKDTQSLDAIKDSGKPQPILDKVRVFQEIKLKNLYRIIRRPEEVLEIAAKNQSTFMWADVQKILARYVDDAALYGRLEAKLLNSPELVFLRMIYVESPFKAVLDTKQDAASKHETAVYTTRTILKAELRLVELGGSMSQAQSHPVQGEDIETVIADYDHKLSEYGGLSPDQKAAIHHITKGDQLSFMVGYAGAGKTTVLSAAKEIWQAQGYKMYGLAPTGKVSCNLEQLGIPSQTLHKFLKQFESGRCRYSSKSILTLDEAGMVDTENFDALLKAAAALGVKVVGVGESTQVQSVEGGAPFRLVTEGAGVARLETVVRQKQEWQREATKLFGGLKTREAIESYYNKGCIEFVEEKMPSLKALQAVGDHRGVVELYNLSRRVAGNMYHSMLGDIKRQGLSDKQAYRSLSAHQDYKLYSPWKITRDGCVQHIRQHLSDCKPYMKELAVNPYDFAKWFGDRSLPELQQLQEAHVRVVKWDLPQCEPHQNEHVCDIRALTKQALIKAFLTSLKANPHDSHLMFTFTNGDTRSLNEEVRFLLKQEDKIGKEDYLFTIHRREEDNLKRQLIFKEDRHFAVGDRLVFTGNDQRLGVNNGTLGTVTSLNSNTIKVQLDGSEKTVSFAPRLYPFFDQGWATTIIKTQGSEARHCFLLAAREMYRNLTYAGMTRHRDSLKVFASKLDFWRDEIMFDKLSRMNEKLMGVDYINSEDAYALMKADDRLLTKIFNRVGDELEAIKYVSKRGWQEVCHHFMGEGHERSIVFPTEQGISEAERAKLLWDEKERGFLHHPQVNQANKQDFPEAMMALAALNAAHAKEKGSQKDMVGLGADGGMPSLSQADKDTPEDRQPRNVKSVAQMQDKNLPVSEAIKPVEVEKYKEGVSKTSNLAKALSARGLDAVPGANNLKSIDKRIENKTIEQQAQILPSKSKKSKPASLEAQVIQASTGLELRRIFKDHFIQTQDRQLNEKDLRLIDKVAPNVTDQVINFRIQAQKQPHKEDLRIFMYRALYEEERIPHIEKATIKRWKEEIGKSHIPSTERPRVRAYAERVALIEGRLYEQAMRNGKNPPHSKTLNLQARQELAKNQKLQVKQAKTWQVQLNMSAYAGSRMANEVLRHQERYGVKPTEAQCGVIKAGVQYQEQRLSALQAELKESVAQDLNRKPNKQDNAHIQAITEYVTRREFESFKRHAFETGAIPNGQQLKQLQNEARADYLKNMKPEVDKIMKHEDKARQNRQHEWSR